MKNLIVQAQRLGDLVMTYPLFIWLKKQDDKEIFVLAEEKFYKEHPELMKKTSTENSENQ